MNIETSAIHFASKRLQIVRLIVVKNRGEFGLASLQQDLTKDGKSTTCSTTSEATIASKPKVYNVNFNFELHYLHSLL
jgi:hypothetical protein